MTSPIIPARLDRNKRRILCGWPPGQPRCSGFFGIAGESKNLISTTLYDPRVTTEGEVVYFVGAGEEKTVWLFWLHGTFIRGADGIYRMGNHARKRYLSGLRPRNRRIIDRDKHFSAGSRRSAATEPPSFDEWGRGFRAACPRCGRINFLHPRLLAGEPVFFRVPARGGDSSSLYMWYAVEPDLDSVTLAR